METIKYPTFLKHAYAWVFQRFIFCLQDDQCRFTSICVRQYLLPRCPSDFRVKIADSWKNSVVICSDLRVSCCHRFIESPPCCLVPFSFLRCGMGGGGGARVETVAWTQHVGDWIQWVARPSEMIDGGYTLSVVAVSPPPFPLTHMQIPCEVYRRLTAGRRP
jgi:hypothetical protein